MHLGAGHSQAGGGDVFFGKKYFVFTFGEKKMLFSILVKQNILVKKKNCFNDSPIRCNVNMEKIL